MSCEIRNIISFIYLVHERLASMDSVKCISIFLLEVDGLETK